MTLRVKVSHAWTCGDGTPVWKNPVDGTIQGFRILVTTESSDKGNVIVFQLSQFRIVMRRVYSDKFPLWPLQLRVFEAAGHAVRAFSNGVEELSR